MCKRPTYEELEKRIVELEQKVQQFQSEAVTYRTLFDSFPHGITVSDALGGIMETNAVAERLLGVEKEDQKKRAIDGREWRIIRSDGTDMPPDEWASVVALREKRLVSNCEMGIVKSGEEVVWINVTAAPLPLEGHGVVITYSDITEKKQAEEALREKEKELRNFFKRAPVGIFQSTPAGKYLTLNDRFANMLGYGQDELSHVANIADLYVDPAQREEVKRLLNEQGHIEDFPIYLRRKDGETMWMSIFVQTRRNENGDIQSYDGFTLDITHRKVAQAALERVRSSIDKVTDSIFWVDKNGRFIDVNDAACQNLGYGHGELLSMGVADVDPNFPQEKWPPHWDEMKQRGRMTIESIHQRKDGKKYPVEIDIYNQQFGDTRYNCVFARDITRRRLVEEELRQAHRMEAIATLTGGIAHDYNNLMSIIMGNLSMAMEEVEPDSFLSDFLNNATAASHKIRNLTHELMSLSRGGTLALEIGSFKDLLKSVSSVLPADGRYSLEKSIAKDLRLFPHDPLKIAAVLRNVMTNAVEAMPGGGTIEIKAENRRVVQEDTESGLALKPGDYIRISIQDQGVGIPKEHLKKVFDPYFSTKEMGTQKGMGLGLTTAYAIVKKHGGHLAINSTPGVGTTISIYLPAESQAQDTDKSAFSTKDAASSVKRVLVMDDEEMLRDLAEQMLKRLGYEAETAKDGMDAIHLYRERLQSNEPFDAVILDLTIKDGMGGEQTMEELRTINPHIKAVVSSGYFNNPVLSDFEQYGFVGKIAKPYELKNLREVLEKVFGVTKLP